jgi:hypothetical protein
VASNDGRVQWLVLPGVKGVSRGATTRHVDRLDCILRDPRLPSSRPVHPGSCSSISPSRPSDPLPPHLPYSLSYSPPPLLSLPRRPRRPHLSSTPSLPPSLPPSLSPFLPCLMRLWLMPGALPLSGKSVGLFCCFPSCFRQRPLRSLCFDS